MYSNWKDSLQDDVVSCPVPEAEASETLAVQASDPTDFLETHVSTSPNVLMFAATEVTFVTTTGIVSRTLEGRCGEWLAEQKMSAEVLKVAYAAQVVYTLTHESIVSDANLTNILTTVHHAIRILVLPLLAKKHAVFELYEVAVISQAGAVVDRGRCDRYLTLQVKKRARGYRRKWVAAERFIPRISAWTEWYAKKQTKNLEPNDSEPELPDLVLVVIEEKRPNVIDPAAFVTDWQERGSQGIQYKNAGTITAQIRKYSVDANCPPVVLSDYKKMVIFKIDDVFERNDTSPIAQFQFKPGASAAISTKIQVQAVTGNFAKMPRFFYFVLAIERLQAAQLVFFPPIDTLRNATAKHVLTSTAAVVQWKF